MSETGGTGPATPYRVLARKYRPQSFDDLIGQSPMVRTLTNAFETGRIAQAWMLTGVRGVGKTTTARILARALNYKTETVDQPTIHMREFGVHCQAIMEGRHVDVVEMDAASHTGIDDIREIIAQVRYRPVSARYKVYIIDEVHMLSNQAFNGLLKTLEEPPEHVKFVFATTEIRKVPITVLSRCQRFDLRRIDSGELMAHLKKIGEAEGVDVEDEALRLMARSAEGSARDALSIFDQAIAHGAGHVMADAVRDMLGLADRVRVIDLFEHLMKGDASAALAELRDQYAAGADPAVVLTDLANFTHLVTSLRFVPGAGSDAALSPAERERGEAFAKTLSVRTLSQVWQMLLKAIEEAQRAVDPRQAVEMALIRIAYAADLPSPDDLLRQIESGGALPSPGGPSSSGGGGGGSGSPASRSSMPVGPGGDAARASASGRGGGSTLSHGGFGAAGVQSRPQPSLQVAADAEPVLDSAEALAALAKEKRDSLLHVRIRRYLRLVKIEPGRLEFAPTPECPAAFAGDLARKLHEWTGRRWVVSISREAGAPTLEEKEKAEHEALLNDASADPDVAAVLDAFPGARIVDVRLRGAPDAVEEVLVEAVETSVPALDDDDLPLDMEAGEPDEDDE
ncbi:DNA polymerase III subunit gamma/tau [Consotaella salsifontis]|uniref:DNA polymerase III subunit gamma/tau n=1 Tax=Consotaella salsifontis TaxID=1365950 RepID=A0A1T4RZT4_9HYPH|nr:DNA polymerase III subunit gamma/tau [Consotaella salsifontis]SKA21475.1 DNA polymerase III, tau subunit [Consotaella salsifontis]